MQELVTKQDDCGLADEYFDDDASVWDDTDSGDDDSEGREGERLPASLSHFS